MRYAAKYYDGLTAGAQPVAITVADAGIVVSAEHGAVLAHWPAEEIVLAELPRAGEPVRLGLEGTTARLIVDDPDVLETLRPVAPGLYGRVRLSWGGLARVVGWAGLAVGSIVFIMLVVVPALSDQLAAVTPDVVRQRIGAAALQHLPDFFAVDESGPPGTREAYCNDARGQNALEAMVARLTADMADPPTVRLVVVNSELVNAFALPGGIVGLTKGFIDNASNAEEVAGVIAHEIGHIRHDHSVKGLYRTAAVAMLVGIVTGDFAGGILLSGAGQWVLDSGYSRVDEQAADVYALERLYAAGIDSGGLEGFFVRLLAAEETADEELLRFLSTHPLTRERIEDVRRAPRASGSVFGGDGRQWSRLRRICRTTQDAPPGVTTR